MFDPRWCLSYINVAQHCADDCDIRSNGEAYKLVGCEWYSNTAVAVPFREIRNELVVGVLALSARCATAMRRAIKVLSRALSVEGVVLCSAGPSSIADPQASVVVSHFAKSCSLKAAKRHN